MKTENLVFHANYYIIIGNNGNHTGYNRVWSVFSNGYPTKIAAINDLRKATAENGDIKFGLTPIRVVSAAELEDIINTSTEQVRTFNCHDIS